MLSQNNLISNLLGSQPLGLYTEDDIALGALPMDHVFGLVLLAGTCVLGYGMYLTPHSDVDSILSVIENQAITRMNGVPALYLSLARNSEGRNLQSLRAGFIGGGPCTVDQFRFIEETLDMTLVPVYGMSECVGVSCGSYQDPIEVRASGVGPFYAANTGVILLEDGTEAVPGEIGEICVDGPMRMVGYYGDTEARSPYLHTGDLGYVDSQGILHITGRKKDIIIRNGVNLSVRRIEEALLSIEGVTDAVVTGIPCQTCGEIPCAMVVTQLPKAVILAQLTARLNKNEIPVGILPVDTIPLTGSAKPDKIKIKEVLTAWWKA